MEYLTIKELADNIGVTKPAVMKKIDNAGLRVKLKQDGKKLLIDKQTAEIVIRLFDKNKRVTTAQAEKKKEKQMQEEILLMLQTELKNKNAQIDQLFEQLKSLQDENIELIKAVRESNTLHAGTMKQLEDVKDNNIVEKAEPNVVNDTEQKKKKFFNRFF